MKTWIIAAIAATALFPAQRTSAENIYKGEKTVGLTGGYHSYNSSGVAGIEFTYRFSKHFRLSPGVMYVFRHRDTDALQLNINADVPFPTSSRCDIYPFAGLCYSSWNRHGSLRVEDENHDVSNRTSRLGLNVGGGVNFAASGNLRLGVRAGYSFIKEYGGAMALATIAYRF